MTTPQQAREQRFASLYADTYADVLRFVQRRAGPGPAEDVAHEAFLVAWRRLDEVPTRQSDARAWLFGTARNCLLNSSRGQVRRDALGVRIAETMPAVTHASDDLVAHYVDLAMAWRRLRPEEQEVLSLAIWDDLTSPQAGRVLGISSAAYRIRLHRARQSLRQLMEAPSPSAHLADRPATETTT